MRRVQEPKGWAIGQGSKLKQKCIICHNSRAQSMQLLTLFIHDINKHFCLLTVIITFFRSARSLRERFEEDDIFPPVEEMVCFPFSGGGATLHIQVTIIMVRCMFCHLGDFLSNWVAWPLCLSLNYLLDLLCSFLPCIFSVILQFAFKLCGYGGSIFPTHHSLMFPCHHFTLSSILKVFTLLIEDSSFKNSEFFIQKLLISSFTDRFVWKRLGVFTSTWYCN